MKKWLKDMLKKKEEARDALKEKGKSSENLQEVRSITEQVEAINEEIRELRSKIDSLPDEEEEQRGQELPAGTEQRGQQPQGAVNVLGTYGIQRQQSQAPAIEDRFSTPEYRSAFMDYVTKGVKSENLEFRADATTGTGDIGAVIPTTILNKVVEKLKDYGRIWARVSKTAMQGGVQIPVANAKPTATWVAAGTVADKQKKSTSGNITFSYFKLQIRVAVELVAGTVAMPVFEQTVTDNIYEAIIVALEQAIISGTGVGQPLGITKDPDIPATQIVEVTPDEFGKYGKWTELFGKVPRSYRNGMVVIMADSDWNKYILGMVDANGQPVARVTYGLDGTQEERLIGKEAIPVEELLPSIDDAAAGDVVGVICKLQDYMFNSNMQLYFKRYFDENTDEWISKSTLIGDGKLADKNGVVLIKKAAAV